ncbi:MAG: hypothetical protein ACI9UV_000222 [Algoriphagus sp.]|jgi:hypothetical protein
MSEIQQNELRAQIEALKATLVGEMFADMEAKDKIYNLEMQLNGTKPGGQYIDCVGCGS